VRRGRLRRRGLPQIGAHSQSSGLVTTGFVSCAPMGETALVASLVGLAD